MMHSRRLAWWLSRRRPTIVTAQSATIIVAWFIVAGVALATLTGVRDSARQARIHTEEAVLAGEILREADLLESSLLAQRSEAADAATSQHMTAAQALSVSEILSRAAASATTLHGLSHRRETLELWGAVEDARVVLERVSEEDAHVPLSQFEPSVRAFADLAALLEPQFHANAEVDNRFNEDLAGVTMLGIIAAICASSAAVGVTTWYLSRRLRFGLVRAERERSALLQTTEVMERRNVQFRALYQIVTEVSESLSMKYVVETTIREARNLVTADVTVLRLLRDDWLEVAGSSASVDASGLGPVKLGAGVCGRAAKRGRSILINANAAAEMAPGEMVQGLQSGVVVPLIVGARVVGTMSCWSREPNKLTEDDQQVLEMMASQVATAVMAAESHRASEELAHTDTLTDLPNRRQLAKDTAERFQPALEAGCPLAVAMIDIDNFKQFNDEFGHKTGDITLQKVASALRASLRDSDSVYRYGGEEFVLVVEASTGEQAVRLMERLRATVARTPFTGDVLQPVGPVTISVGVASCPDGPADFEALVKLADTAMYQSKWGGRNRVTAYSSDLEAIPDAA